MDRVPSRWILTKYDLSRRRQLIDAVGFGGVLIIVGVVYFAHPQVASDFIPFFESFDTYKGPPPYEVFPSFYDAAALALMLLGGWSLLMAAARPIAGLPLSNSISSAFFAVGLILAGYLVKDLGLGALAIVLIVGGVGVIAASLSKR